MAIIEKDINGGNNDYPTISAWQVDNFGSAGVGDDAVANVYGRVIETAKLLINNTAAAATVTIRGATGHRHHGRPNTGTGILFDHTTGSMFELDRNNVTVEWLDIDGGGNNVTKLLEVDTCNDCIIRNNLIRNIKASRTSLCTLFNTVGSNFRLYLYNNIISDLENSASGVVQGMTMSFNQLVHIYNNTVMNIHHLGSGDARGIGVMDSNNVEYKNNLVMNITSGGGITHNFYYLAAPTSTVFENNVSQDNTGNSQEAAFMTDGLLTKAMTNKGQDLGDVPAAIDILGFDRHAQDVVWEVGAHQYIERADGNWVYDLSGSLGAKGFNKDGAFHCTPNASHEFITPIDQNRKHFSLVEHDRIFTVDGVNDLLGAHFKCDDNAANASVVDEKGISTANWKDVATQNLRNTSLDSVVDAVRGRALNAGGVSFIDIVCGAGTIFDNAFYKKGTMIIVAKPQFSNVVGFSQMLMELNVGVGSDRLQLTYDRNNDWITFLVDYGSGSTVQITTPMYLSGPELRVYTIFHLTWDYSTGFLLFARNGVVQANSGYHTLGTASANHPATFTIGTDDLYTGFPGNYLLDDILIFPEQTVIPYGGVQHNLGIDPTGAAAHKAITFHEPLDNLSATTPAVGSGNISVEGSPTLADGPYGSNNAMVFDAVGDYATLETANNFNWDRGCISFWMKSLHAINDGIVHYIYGDRGVTTNAGDVYLLKTDVSALQFTFAIGTSSFRFIRHESSRIPDYSNNWHHFAYVWDRENLVYNDFYIALWYDGVYSEPNTNSAKSTWGSFTPGSYHAIGTDYSQPTTFPANAVFKDFTITPIPNNMIASDWIVLGPNGGIPYMPQLDIS